MRDRGERCGDYANGHGEAAAAAGEEPIPGGERLREAGPGGGRDWGVLCVVPDDCRDERALHGGALRNVRGRKAGSDGGILGGRGERREPGGACDGRGGSGGIGGCSHNSARRGEDTAAMSGNDR